METESQIQHNLRLNGRRRSFSQLSNDISYKELGEQSNYEDDDWCKVTAVKTDKLSVWENERGYQGEVIYLRLTQMLISNSEKLNWQSLTKDIDFSKDPGPILWPTTPLDVAQFAEEGILSDDDSCENEPTVNEYNYCNDLPCSSKNIVQKYGVDVESDGEAMKTDYEDNGETNDTSTETIVQDLLKHFQQQAGSAERTEDLISIVSNPAQNSYTLPVDVPVPVDEIYTVDGKRIRLRGSAIWAPPKRKFIFDLPEIRDHQAQLSLQHFRCAGCGMKLNKLYSRRAKLCGYYNKLFCQCCFVGEKSMIPARILHQWNFKEYPVCDLAYRFLKEHVEHPIYSVRAVNPDMYKKVKSLFKSRQLRIKASHMWQYIKLCPDADITLTKYGNLKTMFSSVPRRFILLEEVDTYSILDFVNVESGNLIEMLEPIVACGKIHIEGCTQCKQRSFSCEICSKRDDYLYSFQLDKVNQCDNCGTLFHKKCYKKTRKDRHWKCPRCERIRKKRLNQHRRSISIEVHSD